MNWSSKIISTGRDGLNRSRLRRSWSQDRSPCGPDITIRPCSRLGATPRRRTICRRRGWTDPTSGRGLDGFRMQRLTPHPPVPGSAVSENFLLAWKSAENNGIHYAIFDSLHWSAVSLVPDAHRSHSPALAHFDNLIHLVWRGPSDHNVYHATFDGVNWSLPRQIPEIATTSQPALATYGGVSSWPGEAWTQGSIGRSSPRTSAHGCQLFVSPHSRAVQARRCSSLRGGYIWFGRGSETTIRSIWPTMMATSGGLSTRCRVWRVAARLRWPSSIPRTKTIFRNLAW